MKVFLLITALALSAAACGGSNSTSSASTPAPSTPAPATAAPSAAPTAAAAPSGPVTAVMEINATGKGGAFEPDMVKVAVGGTVMWTNNSGNIHNVTFADTSIKASTIMSKGDTFTVTFPKAGTYKYTCTYHPGMDGTVVVG